MATSGSHRSLTKNCSPHRRGETVPQIERRMLGAGVIGVIAHKQAIEYEIAALRPGRDSIGFPSLLDENDGAAPDFSDGSAAVKLLLRQEPDEDEDEEDDRKNENDDDDDDEGTDGGYSE